ncbi:MAG TPA: SDR family oxidoreductase [Vicinamibacterales bacterium]|nr:SDR family oxidoreductase [Vicinamibacterales bacterium]
MSSTALIVGASGVVGASAIDSFLRRNWEVIAVSRRSPEVSSDRPFRHLPIDLFDARAAAEALEPLQGITHVVFAALSEKPGLVEGWSDPAQMQVNLEMLRSVIQPLTARSRSLRHVSIMQGTKAYGLHLHPMDIPARERSPRDPHPNFYWLQEDYLKEKAAANGFGYTILRPQMVVGGAIGAAMNTAPVLGAYAAICRELGEPFGFPGGPSFVWEASDARLVGDVLEWAARSEQAHGETFNVTNGDVFEWRNLWPAIADALGVEPAADRPMSLGAYLPAQAGVWDAIVRKHGLRPVSLQTLLGESHHIADFCFATGATQTPPPAFISGIKLRQAGFTDVIDTEDMYRYWLRNLIDRKLLPAR